MKNQTYGWSHLPERRDSVSPTARHLRAEIEAVENYKELRQNGTDKDAPDRPFPEDGKKSGWIKCPDRDTLPTHKAGFFCRGGFKAGWQGEGYYRLRYDEGPGDRAWMEERDRNYLARMEREKVRAKVSALLEEVTKLSHGGQYLEAIELCDYGLAEDSNHLGLRQQRASYHEALFHQSKSCKDKQLYIEKAIKDYQHCISVDEYDEASAIKVDQLTTLLAGLSASSPDAVESGTVSSPAADRHAALESYSEARSAIKAYDEAIARNSWDFAAHKSRAEHFMTLFMSAQTEKFKRRFLERAKADYAFCVDKGDCDDVSSLKVKEIEALLAQFAGASVSSAACGAGAGAAPSPPAPGTSDTDKSCVPGTGGCGCRGWS